MDNDKFNIEDLLNIDKNMIKRINHILKEFSVSELRDKKSFGVMDIMGYPLLLESQKYYNGELLASFAFYKAMKEEGKKLRSYAYCFENLIFRLVAFWEYFYQFLNMYFQLGLYDSTSIKKIVERAGYEVEFVPEDEVTRVQYVPLPVEEQKKRRKEVRGNLRYINKWNVLGAINGMYEPTEKIIELINAIARNNIETIKNTRNQIIHQRPAGACTTVSFDDMFTSGYSMSVNNKGWIDFDKLDEDIGLCFDSIRESFNVIHYIVKYNDYPNEMQNSGKKYFLKNVTCNVCKANYCVPDFLLGEEDKFSAVMICPHCGEMGCEVGERKKVTEIDYGTTFGIYIRCLEELNRDNDDEGY